MIRFCLKVFKYGMNLIYTIFKLKKNRNKVILLSRQSNQASLDFILLKNKLIEEGFEVKIICKKLGEGIANKIGYVFNMVYAMYHLADSKFCFIDGYSIPVSILKHKKGLIVIQIWHALGAIKKFGYQILNKAEGSSVKIADILNMHKNYTYVVCSSKKTRDTYSKTFKINNRKIKVVGMPRVDYLNDLKNRYNKDIYIDYPFLKEKKNIVYVPTFRKTENVKYNQLIDAINKDKYNIIVKLHPLDKNKNNIDSKYLVSDKYTSYDVLAVADYIITDYSAIGIEASILNKPLYFYLYDYKKYIKRRGLNIDLFKEMRSSTFINANDLIESLTKNKYNYNELMKFRKTYVETIGFNNTDAIIKLMKGQV